MANFREFDILNALQTARKERNDLILWSCGYEKGTRILARVLGFSGDNVKLVIKGESNKSTLKKLLSSEKLGVYSQGSNFKFETRGISFYKNRLTIEFPKSINFLYQRRHDRYEVTKRRMVECTNLKTDQSKLNLPVYDISKGGISLLLDPVELRQLQDFDKDLKLTLDLAKAGEKLRARIVSIRKFESKAKLKTHRVSLAFEEIDELNNEVMGQFVNHFDNEAHGLT